MRKKGLKLFFIPVVLIFMCAFTCNPNNETIETKEFEVMDDGYIRYYTNDSDLKGTIQIKTYTGETLGFTYSKGIDVKLKKHSGDKNGFFGVIATVKTNLSYALVIDLNKTYKVFKVIGEDVVTGTWTDLLVENIDDLVVDGYESINTFNITYEDFEERLRFWINDEKVFYVDIIDGIEKNDISYYVEITNDEDFTINPNPVDVRIKFIPIE